MKQDDDRGRRVLGAGVAGAAVAALCGSVLLLAGCNTVSGLGQDIQEGSDAVRNAIAGDDAARD